MFDIFGWIRRKTREAVLGGIADAVQEVAPGEQAPADLEGLRRLVAAVDVKALPTIAEEEEDEPKRKARGK